MSLIIIFNLVNLLQADIYAAFFKLSTDLSHALMQMESTCLTFCWNAKITLGPYRLPGVP